MTIPYMPLYISDYLADASHLTTLQHGAYLLLIMNYWQRGKALNNFNGCLANVARLSSEEWQNVEPVISKFFTIEGDVWTHQRIEDELLYFRLKSEKARQAGKASAQRRGSKRTAEAKPVLSERSTDVEQTLNHTDTDIKKKKKKVFHVERTLSDPPDKTPKPSPQPPDPPDDSPKFRMPNTWQPRKDFKTRAAKFGLKSLAEQDLEDFRMLRTEELTELSQERWEADFLKFLCKRHGVTLKKPAENLEPANEIMGKLNALKTLRQHGKLNDTGKLDAQIAEAEQALLQLRGVR